MASNSSTVIRSARCKEKASIENVEALPLQRKSSNVHLLPHGHPPQHRRSCRSWDHAGSAEGAPHAASGRQGADFGLRSKIWLFWRKGDPRSCCDRVEFTGHQQSEIAGMMDMVCELACSISGAPKDIGTGWTDDR
jgi:hypothetical protein